LSATLLDELDHDAESIGLSSRCAALLCIDVAEISILVQFCTESHARRPQLLIATTFCTCLIILCGVGLLVLRLLIKHALEENRSRCWHGAERRDRNEITKYEFNEQLKHSVDHELRLLSALWNVGESGMQSSFVGVAAFIFWALCVVAVGV